MLVIYTYIRSKAINNVTIVITTICILCIFVIALVYACIPIDTIGKIIGYNADKIKKR